MKAAAKRLLNLARKSGFTGPVSPMLCTLTREPVTSEEYIYEIKFDGYRIIGYRQNAKVRLASRSGFDYTSKYPNVEQSLKTFPLTVSSTARSVPSMQKDFPILIASRNHLPAQH